MNRTALIALSFVPALATLAASACVTESPPAVELDADADVTPAPDAGPPALDAAPSPADAAPDADAAPEADATPEPDAAKLDAFEPTIMHAKFEPDGVLSFSTLVNCERGVDVPEGFEAEYDYEILVVSPDGELLDVAREGTGFYYCNGFRSFHWVYNLACWPADTRAVVSVLVSRPDGGAQLETKSSPLEWPACAPPGEDGEPFALEIYDLDFGDGAGIYGAGSVDLGFTVDVACERGVDVPADFGGDVATYRVVEHPAGGGDPRPVRLGRVTYHCGGEARASVVWALECQPEAGVRAQMVLTLERPDAPGTFRRAASELVTWPTC